MERQQYAETRDGIHSYATRNLPPGFTPDIPVDGGNKTNGISGVLADTGSMQGSIKKGSIKSGSGSLMKKGGSKKGGSRRNSVAMSAMHEMLQPIMEDDGTYKLYINLQAFAYTADAYRQLHPKCNYFCLSKQTDAYPNTAVPKQAGFASTAAPD